MRKSRINFTRALEPNSRSRISIDNAIIAKNDLDARKRPSKDGLF
jgi:hypothetical protein